MWVEDGFENKYGNIRDKINDRPDVAGVDRG